ncbi:hypothetical protein AAY473_004543 [Plecturocebus cupreus]
MFLTGCILLPSATISKRISTSSSDSSNLCEMSPGGAKGPQVGHSGPLRTAILLAGPTSPRNRGKSPLYALCPAQVTYPKRPP